MRSTLALTAASLLCASVAAAPASRFKFYEMKTPLAGPCDLTTGPDGAIWVQDFLVNKIARVDPQSGDVQEYDIPYTNNPLSSDALPSIDGRTAFACAIQPGDDGKLYAATGVRNQFLRIDPKTKAIKVFTPSPPNPAGNLKPFNDLYAAPNGMYFTQTTGNVVTFFDYQTEQFKSFPVPTPNAGPLGLIYGSDGGVWFTEFLANKIARFDPKTETFKEYPVPLTGSQPTVMRAETEGKYLWFTCFVGNSMGRIEMSTGKVKIFPNTTPLSFPTEDTVDSKGNVWFSTATINALNYVVPSTGKIVSIEEPGTSVLSPISAPPFANIAIHYGPGDAIWFTELSQNKVGRYALS